MVITVDSVKSNSYNNSAAFLGKKKNKEIPEDYTQRKSNKMATIPVALMIAMSPINGANSQVKTIQLDPETVTELLAYSPQQQNSYDKLVPLAKWKTVVRRKIQFMKAIVAQGAKYEMVFTTGLNSDPNSVKDVFLVNRKEMPRNEHQIPPTVKALVYHDLGEGEGFCGVEVKEDVVDKNGKKSGVMFREIRLQDDDANLIIDLIANDTKWKNCTNIEFKKTNSPDLKKPWIL